MRVLQFGRFWHAQHGGIERHVTLLARGLAAAGVEVVNLVAAPGRQGSDDVVDGVRVVQVPSFGMAFGTAMAPALPARARALHRERPFDVMHLHLPDPLSHVAQMLLPRTVRRVVTWHSDIVRQRRLLALYRPFMEALLHHADALVAATPAHFTQSAQIPADIPEARRYVIPFGLDYDALRLTPRTEALARELRMRAQGRPIVFALGRHVYYKGFDVLIDAMAGVDAELLLGGDGPLRQALQARAAQGPAASRIQLCGRVAEEDLAAYYHACDLFCLPSVEPSEAFGLVQLEAMACGKAVVCTRLGNGVNVVNQDGVTGLSVPPRDAHALGAALSALLGDPARREAMGRQGERRAHDEYSLPAMTARTLALYRSLLAAPA